MHHQRQHSVPVRNGRSTQSPITVPYETAWSMDLPLTLRRTAVLVPYRADICTTTDEPKTHRTRSCTNASIRTDSHN
eukprot:scaffold37767_cov21-Prasinocladus_malaysianus.AAC.1